MLDSNRQNNIEIGWKLLYNYELYIHKYYLYLFFFFHHTNVILFCFFFFSQVLIVSVMYTVYVHTINMYSPDLNNFKNLYKSLPKVCKIMIFVFFLFNFIRIFVFDFQNVHSFSLLFFFFFFCFFFFCISALFLKKCTIYSYRKILVYEIVFLFFSIFLFFCAGLDWNPKPYHTKNTLRPWI